MTEKETKTRLKTHQKAGALVGAAKAIEGRYILDKCRRVA